MFETMIYILLGIVFGSVVTIIILSKKYSHISFEAKNSESKTRRLEKEIFAFESDKAKQINEILVEKSNEIRKTYSDAFEAGREHGVAQGQANVAVMVTQAKGELLRSFEQERVDIFESAKIRARAEYEENSKIFTVNVRPYVKIIEDKGYFNHIIDSESGYQYQLYVNGIPAFQPHIVIEKSESTKITDKENVDKVASALMDNAVKLTRSAASTYLGGFGSICEEVLLERRSK